MPNYRVEQRWSSNTRSAWYRDGVWCLIDEEGRAYAAALANRPFDMDSVIRDLDGKPIKRKYSADSELTRRSPPGTDEETWLRENDTRHPEYQGL